MGSVLSRAGGGRDDRKARKGLRGFLRRMVKKPQAEEWPQMAPVPPGWHHRQFDDDKLPGRVGGRVNDPTRAELVGDHAKVHFARDLSTRAQPGTLFVGSGREPKSKLPYVIFTVQLTDSLQGRVSDEGVSRYTPSDREQS
jgi:hypothetical protein